MTYNGHTLYITIKVIVKSAAKVHIFALITNFLQYYFYGFTGFTPPLKFGIALGISGL